MKKILLFISVLLTFVVSSGLVTAKTAPTSKSAKPKVKVEKRTAPPKAIAQPKVAKKAPAARKAQAKVQAKPKSRPASVESWQVVQMDARGSIYAGNGIRSFEQTMELLEKWKKQKAKVHLIFSQQTPVSKLNSLRRLFRLSGIAWKETRFFSNVAAPKRATPPKRTAPPQKRAKHFATKPPVGPASVGKTTSAPTSTPTSQATKVRTGDWSKQLNKRWSGVRVTRQRGIKGPHNIELRVQAAYKNGKKASAIPAALILFRSSRQRPVARVRSDHNGRWRFQIQGLPGDEFRLRVVMLKKGSLMNFPIPIRRAVNGKLYLKILLDGKVKAPASNIQPIKVPKIKKKKLPWTKIPLFPEKGLKKKPTKGTVELRIRLQYHDGGPGGGLVSGLIVEQGKKRTPMAFAKSYTDGRLRFLVKANRPGVRKLVLIYRKKPYALNIPVVDGSKKLVKLKLTVPFMRVSKVAWNGLTIFHVPISPKKLRITHFVNFTYEPGEKDKNKDISVWLPWPKGATKLTIGKNAQHLGIKETKGKLGFRSSLSKGSYQLAYSCVLPAKNFHFIYEMKFGADIPKVAFMAPMGINLKNFPKAPKQVLSFGQGKGRYRYQSFRLPKGENAKTLNINVVPSKSVLKGHGKLKNSPKKVKGSGLMAWIKRTNQNPNKRNKLLGIGVIAAVSVLGLFLLLGGKRKEDEEEQQPGTSE